MRILRKGTLANKIVGGIILLAIITMLTTIVGSMIFGAIISKDDPANKARNPDICMCVAHEMGYKDYKFNPGGVFRNSECYASDHNGNIVDVEFRRLWAEGVGKETCRELIK